MTTVTAPAADDQASTLRRLIDVGIALSAERNHDRLMERILLEAKDIYNADGGTLYVKDRDRLVFSVMRTDTMNIKMGGTTGTKIPFPPLALYGADGKPNHNSVATHVAITGQLVNIPDAYVAKDFDFTGTKKFDATNNYRSKSFLTLPLKNYENEVVGVLQLINARDRVTGEVREFDVARQSFVEALASQAAVALDNHQLLEGQRNLLESFVKLIANAIERKSPYTSGHCQRVPVLTNLLAEAACAAQAGPFADFKMTEDERYELHMAAWMHDCGKVVTPEYVMDKSTKLQTIFDRIETVRTRFAVLERDAELAYWKKKAANDGTEAERQAALDATLAQIREDRAFIESTNVGGEFLADEKIERIHKVATRRWRDFDGKDQPFLSENEIYNLSIRKGTLTTEERKVISDHVVVTIEMLGQLPFPKNLQRVPEYAGGHHERMDGKGYPKGLKRDDMSIPARMMAIADIYEALTAADRPYKKAMTLSQSLKIMKKMKGEGHIDSDLFQLFIESGAYRKYAEAHLKPEQLDTVDERELLTA